ncbi:ADP-ribosylglycohydrolase family protein [Novosphingobium bradum]|uniref:ADP-ribosylglycohydrolase family protein n=1 Tax=Novosphingobium bradum TaxID=1737444 RepID=A0ABV7IQR9_9SPHN
MRTSLTHPIEIATISAGTGATASNWGRVGLTFCPGKHQASAFSGAWARDLGLDLDAVAAWGAAAVVTLVEDHELAALNVERMGEAVADRHMAWYHLPIPDVTGPNATFEAKWRRHGPVLRGLLQAGFDVLVHCKGGLGRAGTISARLLVELGWEPAAAIAAVRRVRPGAIETTAQERHVRAQGPVAEALPDTSLDAMRRRAQGAFLGLAVGDAVGTTLEFTRRDAQPRLTGMDGGGPFRLRPGEWTDDTAMALALGDSLETCDGLNEADLMRRFVKWRDEGAYSCTGICFDIGVTTSAALSRFQRNGDPLAGSTDQQSAGNGSLMRLAPVAVASFRDRERMRDWAERQSRTTHGAPEAIDACIAFAECLADAINGLPRDEVLAPRSGGWSGRIAPIMAGSWRGKRRAEIRASGYVAHSLEAALWCVARTGTFAEAVLLAANLGEDADTTAAITGQLAGALYGVDGIPAEWREQVALGARIEAVAGRLFDQRDT